MRTQKEEEEKEIAIDSEFREMEIEEAITEKDVMLLREKLEGIVLS